MGAGGIGEARSRAHFAALRHRVAGLDRNQVGAALGTTASEHAAAAFGGHAGAETVCTGAVNFAGLISAFHCNDSKGEATKRPRSLSMSQPMGK